MGPGGHAPDPLRREDRAKASPIPQGRAATFLWNERITFLCEAKHRTKRLRGRC
jgi:hypothetical protein